MCTVLAEAALSECSNRAILNRADLIDIDFSKNKPSVSYRAVRAPEVDIR